MATVNNSNSENYFFFLDGANTDLALKASDLMYMAKDGATELHLWFNMSPWYHAEIDQDTDRTSDPQWKFRRQLKVVLSVATGKGKRVMQQIALAANTPVTVGDPNSRFDRGWIVVADDVNSAYLDADITGVAWTIDAAGNTPT